MSGRRLLQRHKMFYTGGAIHIILSVTQLAKVHDARIALYTVWQKSLANYE